MISRDATKFIVGSDYFATIERSTLPELSYDIFFARHLLRPPLRGHASKLAAKKVLIGIIDQHMGEDL